MSRDGSVLLGWAGEHRRDLPWRQTRDPWAVLVSEVMLQQTQVARVEPVYLAFIGRFPTPARCANGEPGQVITSWRGLGYNRRALNLHRAARQIVDDHGGAVPDSLENLLQLPGVGDYTARAVLAFAFERDVGVVDTNVARVLARSVGRQLARREVQDLADRSVPVGEGWAWNQGLLDLGATICTANDPACGSCPLAGECHWGSRRRPEPDPAVGSAGVSGRQSRFDGSDRQGRGRLVDALRRGAVRLSDLADVMGWPDQPDRASRVLAALVDEGMAVREGELLRLP